MLNSFWIFLGFALPHLMLANNCSSIPPSLWCSHKDIIASCNFTQICTRYLNYTHNQPVHLNVLVEALCPDTQNFLINQLFPNVYKNFAGFVNIDFVPYGNAKIVKGDFICQHGEEECRINRYESCIIHVVKDQNLFVPLIYCIENQLKAKTTFEKASQKCLRTLSIGQDLQKIIQNCDSSELGHELQLKAANETASIWPDKHTNIPWVVFNDVSLSFAQQYLNNIPALICQWYTGDKPIPYCEKVEKTVKCLKN